MATAAAAAIASTTGAADPPYREDGETAAAANSDTANSGAVGGAAISAAALAAAYGLLFPRIGHALPVSRPPEGMLRESGGTVFVGGMAIGGPPQPPPVAEKRGRGKGRGECAPPHCKACVFEEAAEQRQLDYPGANRDPPKARFFRAAQSPASYFARGAPSDVPPD